MYTVVLALHSVVRWAVLLAAAVAVTVTWRGWLTGRPWTRGVNGAGVALVASADTQLLLGLLLYLLLSPFTLAGHGLGALADPAFRYYAVYHPLLGIGVAALAHLGRALSRREKSDMRRHRVAAMFYVAALWVALFTVPWPNMSLGRPLLPF